MLLFLKKGKYDKMENKSVAFLLSRVVDSSENSLTEQVVWSSDYSVFVLYTFLQGKLQFAEVFFLQNR